MGKFFKGAETMTKTGSLNNPLNTNTIIRKDLIVPPIAGAATGALIAAGQKKREMTRALIGTNRWLQVALKKGSDHPAVAQMYDQMIDHSFNIMSFVPRTKRAVGKGALIGAGLGLTYGVVRNMRKKAEVTAGPTVGGAIAGTLLGLSAAEHVITPRIDRAQKTLNAELRGFAHGTTLDAELRREARSNRVMRAMHLAKRKGIKIVGKGALIGATVGAGYTVIRHFSKTAEGGYDKASIARGLIGVAALGGLVAGARHLSARTVSNFGDFDLGLNLARMKKDIRLHMDASFNRLNRKIDRSLNRPYPNAIGTLIARMKQTNRKIDDLGLGKYGELDTSLTSKETKLVRRRALRGGNLFGHEEFLQKQRVADVSGVAANLTLGVGAGLGLAKAVSALTPKKYRHLTALPSAIAGAVGFYGIGIPFSAYEASQKNKILNKHYLKARGITEKGITPEAKSTYLTNFDREKVKKEVGTVPYMRKTLKASRNAKRELRNLEETNRTVRVSKYIGAAALVGAAVIKPKFVTQFSKVYKRVLEPTYKAPAFTKFGSTLRTIFEVAKLPKRLIGADPEIIGLATTPAKNLITRGLAKLNLMPNRIANVGETPGFPSLFGRQAGGSIHRDPTVYGIEINPKASQNPTQLVDNMRTILRRHKKTMKEGETLTNLASSPSGFGGSPAGGHIHLDVRKGESARQVHDRGTVGSLLTHYIVPGAKQRAESGSYGKEFLSSRSLRGKRVEVRSSPTWMESAELAENTLTNVKLTAGHPEIREDVDRFSKHLMKLTGGKTSKLYTQRAHKDVMNFFEKMYGKLGVTGDPATAKIFDRAAKARPEKINDIFPNWGIA